MPVRAVRMQIRFALGVSATIVLASTTAVAQVPCTATAPADPHLQPLRARIVERVGQDIPSVAIAVVADGRIVWEEAIGWADREKRIASTPETIYPIASVSKSLSSMAAVVLRDEYGISFDTPISEFLDTTLIHPLAGPINRVTIRDLLGMTGGFPMGGKSRIGDAPDANPLELLRDHGGLIVFPPGEVFHYANFSPSVLEPIVERVTRQSFGTFMRRDVLAPLGMTSTFFDVYDQPPPGATLATTYRANGSPYLPNRSLPAGGGGARSSLHDMALLALTHLGERSGPAAGKFGPRRIPELYEPSTLSGGHYALGWWIQAMPGGTTILKSDGWGIGVIATVMLNPAQRLGVVVLTNIRRPEPTDPLNRQYADIVATEALEAMDPGFQQRYEAMLRAEKDPRRHGDLGAILLANKGKWEGFVRSYTGEEFPVAFDVRDNDDIHVQLRPQFETVVTGLRLIEGGVIAGQFPSSMPNDEGFDTDHLLRVSLLPHDGELIGYFASNWGTRQSSFDLPHFARLRRVGHVSTRAGPDGAAVRAAIDSGYAEYIAAYAAQDARALARVYDAEGMRLSGNGRVAQGRDSIAASVDRFLERVGPVRVAIELVDLWVVGDMAYETGIWSYTYTPPGNTERTIGGRYVTSWRRQPDGRWRILTDLGVPGTSLPDPEDPEN